MGATDNAMQFFSLMPRSTKNIMLTVAFMLSALFAFAHPMPNSVLLLTVHQNHISGEIQIPLAELQSAIGMKVNDNSDRLIERLGDTLRTYLRQHIRPMSFDGKPWEVILGNMKVMSETDSIVGQYNELITEFSIKPPVNSDLRNFYLYYDAVIHQVITHKVLVAVKQDWKQGQLSHDKATEVGVIELDIPTMTIKPFQISLQQGSNWRGFQKMFTLGRHHISQGIDHLMFLLVLLLPAVLQPPSKQNKVESKEWGGFVGIKASLLRLLKIVTAFTIGHSITLMLAATQIVHIPAQPIEVLIAISILISAIHAYRPIFAGKEIWIAAGFGLIHGLAFAETLVDLDLELKPMLLSILGFNIGIEAMQLLIVLLTIPWLILLSQTKYYKPFRIIGAVVVSIAAMGWVAERISGNTNFITEFLEKFSA